MAGLNPNSVLGYAVCVIYILYRALLMVRAQSEAIAY